MKKISIVVPCYNEEENVFEMYQAIQKVMGENVEYDYEIIFIDNASVDDTPRILRRIAEEEKRAKIIFNLRNFGPGRSGSYAFFQATGDATLCLACDFQDPPELIPEFIKKWEEGYKVAWGKKTSSEEEKGMYAVRSLYYYIIKKFSNTKQYDHVTGFGIYDSEVVNLMKKANDPSPNFRNLIAEFGFSIGFIEYEQPKRKAGKSSYNFFRYFDTALTSLVNTSKAPLKLAIFCGVFLGGISFLLGIFYLILKLLFWGSFKMGVAPILTGVFFIGSVQLLSIGILGEYIGEILDRVTKRPLVIEKERINF